MDPQRPLPGRDPSPDITLIAPVFADEQLLGFAASRAHHADIGGPTPAGMPVDSRRLDDEGVVIPPTPIHGIEEPRGSRSACAAPAAARRPARPARGEPGRRAPHARDARRGLDRLRDGMREILDYAERRTRAALAELPDGRYEANDVLEDDLRDADVSLHVAAVLEGDRLVLDSGTDPQVDGNPNCPLSVTKSASFFAVRVLTDPDAPSAGAHRPIEVCAPDGCLLNAGSPAAVAAGTSRRRAASPTSCSRHSVRRRAPRTGSGTMNNLTLAGEGFTYYETTGGGQGACPAPTARARSTSRCRTPSTPPSRRSRASFQSGCASCRCAGERRRALQGRRRRGPRARGARADALRPDHRAAHAPCGREGGEDGARGRNTLNGNPPLEGRGRAATGRSPQARDPRWRRVSIRLATSLTTLGLPRSCSTIRALKRA